MRLNLAALARPAVGSVGLDNRQPLAGGTLSLDLRRVEREVWPGVDMTRALFLDGREQQASVEGGLMVFPRSSN